MRFKIGSKVEVLTKKKVPSGVWRCAEIVAYNGDGYTVRYYRCPDIVKEGVDKVLADAVRPCPPVTDSVAWAVGDVVEVLDGGYWKVSVIEEDMGQGCYQIRVIGSFDEFRVKISNIRMRQEWKDNKWILLGKDSGSCEDMITRMRKKARMQQQGDLINVQPIAKLSMKSLKRTFSDISSTDASYSESMQKRRVASKKAKIDAVLADSYSYTGKVDFKGNLNETQAKDDLQIITKEITEFNSAGRRSENDSVSSISSVASCSVIDPLPDRVLSHASTSCSQDTDSLCSDAESSYPLGDEEENSVGEWQDASKTHELDLRSYRHILEALYACGPLSWENEFLLTNIRMKLYVSNDEHLMELRRLRCLGGVALSCH